MNGECKSFRLNEPMGWKEFKSMPDDIKVTYLKLLRQKFNVPFNHIGKAMGCSQKTISLEIGRLGLSEGKSPKGRSKKWDRDGFYAWWHGVDLPVPVPEEDPAEESIQEEVISTSEEPEIFVEDDIPFEEPDPVMDEKILTGIHPSKAELLKAERENANAENGWLRNECDNLRMQVRILEAQMDVVRLIFGGQNRG